jgi:hypothetical protein
MANMTTPSMSDNWK